MLIGRAKTSYKKLAAIALFLAVLDYAMTLTVNKGSVIS